MCISDLEKAFSKMSLFVQALRLTQRVSEESASYLQSSVLLQSPRRLRLCVISDA